MAYSFTKSGSKVVVAISGNNTRTFNLSDVDLRYNNDADTIDMFEEGQVVYTGITSANTTTPSESSTSDLFLNAQPRPQFNGPAYDSKFDLDRLTGQIRRVYDLMIDGKWRTLGEIEAATGDPAASISAQLRHLRKTDFGSHTVNKRSRGERKNGLWEYQVVAKVPPSS